MDHLFEVQQITSRQLSYDIRDIWWFYIPILKAFHIWGYTRKNCTYQTSSLPWLLTGKKKKIKSGIYPAWLSLATQGTKRWTRLLGKSGYYIRLIVRQLLIKSGWQDAPLALRDFVKEFCQNMACKTQLLFKYLLPSKFNHFLRRAGSPKRFKMLNLESFSYILLKDSILKDIKITVMWILFIWKTFFVLQVFVFYFFPFYFHSLYIERVRWNWNDYEVAIWLEYIIKFNFWNNLEATLY